MSNLQVITNENKPQIEGVQLFLGVEGEVDRAVIETIKGIKKEVQKMLKMKYLGNVSKSYVSYRIQTDPNTLAFVVKYLGFPQPEVNGYEMETSVSIYPKKSYDFGIFIYLVCPFEVKVV